MELPPNPAGIEEEKIPEEPSFETLSRAEADIVVANFFSGKFPEEQVAQRFGKVYEGKPLVSEGFSECSATVVMSPRSIALLHVDPSTGIGDSAFSMLTQHFPKEEPVTVISIAREASRPSEAVAADMGGRNGWTVGASREIRFPQPGGFQRWNVALDPDRGSLWISWGGGRPAPRRCANLNCPKATTTSSTWPLETCSPS